MPILTSFSNSISGGFGLLRSIIPAIPAAAGGNPTRLGSAFDYSVYGGTVTIAGASSANWIVGGASTAISGVTCGSSQVFSPDPRSAVAASDIQAAFSYYSNLTPGGTIWLGAASVVTSPNFSGDIAGLRFTPGVYFAGAAITNSITVTCDAQGKPDAIFVFQISAAFAPAAGSQVALINGANAKNVFWAITGATAVGAGADFQGTIVSPAAIGLAAGATMTGRLLTNAGAVTMSANTLITN